jgi:ferredoxin
MITFIFKDPRSKKPPQELLSVPCFRALNILAHAQMEELDIGSLCGGHGICGGDRIQLPVDTLGTSPITEKEKEHLSPEEIQAGWRLGCQCWPERDELDISIFLTNCINP